MGYLRFSDSGKAIVAVKTIHVDSTKGKIKQEMQTKLHVIRKEMYHPSANSLKGKWLTKIGQDGFAEITFDGNNFELIYSPSPHATLRKFSKGTYKYSALNGVIELTPKKGEKPSLQSKEIRYKILTMRKFQIVILKKRDDSTLYFSALDRDILGKRYHPIFMYNDYASTPVLEFIPLNNAIVNDVTNKKQEIPVNHQQKK